MTQDANNTYYNVNYGFSNEYLNTFFNILGFLKDTYNVTDDDTISSVGEQYGVDDIISNIALSERNKTTKFFNSIIDQPSFNTLDHKRLRRLVIDWYSAQKTLVTHMKQAVDPFFLTNPELDEIIKSLGFPYPNRIISREVKVGFLYSLIDFLKRKGTPYVFGEALQYFGLLNVVISEWWLYQNPNTKDLYFKSQPVYPRSEVNNSEYIVNRDYSQLTDLYWYYTEDQVKSLALTNTISLPSLTPFISVNTTLDINRIIVGTAILQRIMQESYTYWIEYTLNYVRDIEYYNNDPSTPTDISKVYIIGSSPSGSFVGYENYYVRYSNTHGWVLNPPKLNDCVYSNTTETHWVYNGNDWVDLTVELPSSLFNVTRRGNLNRDIPLTNFKGKYSIYEIMLAIDYLFDSPTNGTTDENYFYYRGKYSPIDKLDSYAYSGYSAGSSYSGIETYRDNIPDLEDYSVIYDEYYRVTRRPATRDIRDLYYSIRQRKFETELITPDSTNDDKNQYVMTAVYNNDVFLEAANYDLKSTIDDFLGYKERSEVLRLLLLDFETYLIKKAKIMDTPFTYAIIGAPIYTLLKDIVDFFKPYRARITDFTSSLGIYDRTGDQVIEDDRIIITSNKDFSGEDNLDITDLLKANWSYVINDTLGRIGTDPHYYLDLALQDALEMEYNFLLDTEDIITLDEEFDTTINLYFVDQCPDRSNFLDSSTLEDSIEIESVPVT